MMEPLRTENGWKGVFTREEAEGAYPNGSRIVKVNTEVGDDHADGATGKVLGSIGPVDDTSETGGNRYGYFVEWDDAPYVAVGVMEKRIQLEEGR